MDERNFNCTGRDMNIDTTQYRVPALIFTALLGLAVLGGCEQDGPAERAGERFDEAVEDSGDRVEQGMENAGDQLEEAGDAIEDRTR